MAVQFKVACFKLSWLTASLLAPLSPIQESYVSAQETNSADENFQNESISEDNQLLTKSKTPKPRTHYLGREIAQTMHYEGAPWLIRDSREREERCSMMLANLGLKTGMVVCDLGSGNGFHSLQIAKLVGKSGTVVAVDVQPTMLKLLRDRMEGQGIENVIPILGSFHNPRLPEKTIDLILMVDVYHELSHPELMLKYMKRSLKSGGQIVLVEFRAEDPDVPIKPLHKMSKKQIKKEMKANGLTLSSEFEGLPWQHMMFFEQNIAKK